MGSKVHFQQWKTHYPHFIDRSLKFKEMEYLIHHVKFEMWPALCKFPILFSTVKLQLRHNSQFFHRFKIGTFESYSLAVISSFSQFTKKLKIGIFEC